MHLHPCYFIDESGKRLGLWRCPLLGGLLPVPAPILFERLLVQNFIASRRRPSDGMPSCGLAAWIVDYGIRQIGICILRLLRLAVSTTIPAR